MKKLVQKLKRSMILGNIDRTKMRIIFEDNEGKKEVRTTVWAVGDKNIVLKIIQDKIKPQKNFPKIKDFSRIESKMEKVNDEALKSSLNNFLK